MVVVVVVTQGAEGGQEGRHDHHHGDDGGDEGVRGPLVCVDRGVLRAWTSSVDTTPEWMCHLDSKGGPAECA